MASPAVKAVKDAVLKEWFEAKGGPFEVGTSTHPIGMPGDGIFTTTKCWAQCPVSLRALWDDMFLKYAQKEFIVYERERYTYHQVWQIVSALGSQLVTRFGGLSLLLSPFHHYACFVLTIVQNVGVKPGDRVGMCMRNYPEWLLSFLAATAIGAVAVPLNSFWQEQELAYAMEDSGCKVLFCDPEPYACVDPRCTLCWKPSMAKLGFLCCCTLC